MATVIDNPLLDVDEEFVAPEGEWSDSHAREVVKRDFAFAENYLSQNHYQRWNNADRIYLAWTEQKYWEGTKVPRACPSVFTAFTEVESLLPIYMATVFSDDPWAEAVPRSGTKPEQARLARDFILSQFRDAGGKQAFKRAAKSGLIYGNGILELGWESFTRKRTRYQRTWKPEIKTTFLPMIGKGRVPTGNWIAKVTEKEVEEQVNRPFIRYISLRDFYVDPNCQSPNVQDARYVIKRCWMTVDELDALRDEDGFNIPSMADLLELSHQKSSSQGDSSKTSSAAYRGEQWQPSLDQTSDAAGKNIEVWNYWTKDRCVWLLGREHVAWNEENSYRDSIGDPVIPFFDQYYTDVLDRFYALGLTDVTEWEQRLIVSLLGARLDELALNINPPRVKRRGVGILSAAQLRTRPGAIADAENPKDDVVQQSVSNVTQQAFIEVQASDSRTQRTTGLAELTAFGTAPSGGNAAARTATGAQIQNSAGSRRMLYLVENSEDECLSPALDFIAGMNRDYLDPDQMLEFSGPKKEQQQADPLHVKNAVVKFEMRSGSRARSAAKLQQMLPLVLQTVMNPEVMQLQGKLGKKLDIDEILNIVADAADYKPRGAWYVDMTPEEQQAMNAPPPPPPPDPTKIKMQQDRLQATGEIQREKMSHDEDNLDAKNTVDLLKELIRSTKETKSATKAISGKSDD